MFEKTAIRQGKTQLIVRLCLTDGTEVEGELWCGQDQRLADLLNDSRGFLPLGVGESVRVISKSVIATAEPMDGPPQETDDPYELLRIERSASDAEVRSAWMSRMKACHPDRLVNLGLDESVVWAARKMAQKINAAHDEVMRVRRGVAA